MFIATLFITVKNWKTPKCPLTVKWINTAWQIQTENGTEMKIQKLLPYSATWLNLTKKCLAKKDEHNRVPLT